MSIIKTAIKKYDSTAQAWDELHPASSGTIVRVGEEIEVMGQAVGSLSPGDKILATDSVATILKKMVQTRIAATYTAPTESLVISSGTAKGTYEVGTSIDATLKATFTQNDAGALTSHKISIGGTDVVTGTDNPATYTYTHTLGDETINCVATAAYGQGALKQDNLGDDSPNGRIAAGSKTSSVSYTGIRKGFYGTDAAGVETGLTTSSEIRALTASAGKWVKGTTFTMTVPKGSTRCTIAFDATIGSTISKVLYVEGSNTNVVGQFKFTSVDVEGANGYTAKSYTVGTLGWSQPTAADMTFNVTL